MYVCICRAVTDEKLKQLMSQGHRSIKELQNKCKVGADCGCCLQDIKKMLSSGDFAVEDHHRDTLLVKD